MPMTTHFFQDIIARCHERRENSLKQRKTTIKPRLYKGLPYHFTVYCAHRYPVALQDLEAVGISFMPIGRAPETDRPPRSFGGERFLKRQRATDWSAIRWHKSWEIHLYTGIPSAREGASWHDIDFTYEALCAAPDAVLACVQGLVGAVANPLLTLSKSGGLRFSCRIPGYLHPNTLQSRLYVCKGTPTAENSGQHEAYLEIVGEKGHNCWDARYEILLGNLLDPPVIPKDALFAPIDALRAKFHEPVSQSIRHKEIILDAPYSLGSAKLDLAKEAFFKRGFSYIRQKDRFHYWRQQGAAIGKAEVSLWENEAGVWIRADTADTGLPTAATLITDVWNDTGILPPLPATGLPIDDKVLAVRAGKLSPLGIKRPRPVLQKSEPTEKMHETGEEMRTQVQRAFDRNVRVLGFITQTDTEQDPEVESVLPNKGAICLNVPNDALAAETAQLLQNRNAANAQILEDRRLFLDPQYAKIAEQLLDVRDGTQRVCLISAKRANQLFLEYELSKATLEAWVANWQGDALGKFAITVLNAVEIRNKSHADFIKRLRTVIQTFEWLEAEIIEQMSQTVRGNPNWTVWHQLKRFFAHYTRNADAPMQWEDEMLQFWVPPVLHSSVRHLLVTAATLQGRHLHQAFLDEKTEILDPQPMAWVPGNRVFQMRTSIYPMEAILELDNTWDVLGVSETGQHIFWRIQTEIERDPNIKHGIITYDHATEQLNDIAKNENVCFLMGFRREAGLETAFQEAQVIWIVGLPEIGPRAILKRTRILFGNDEKPVSYEMEPEFYRYKDARVRSVYEKEVTDMFTRITGLAQLHRLANKKIMWLTGLRIPEITDRPETLLFDWEDLDVAGGLDKLSEVIATRQRFETERDNLTPESSRKEVEAVLGCSTRQANRVLQRLRGGKLARVTFREQILTLLADGEKRTPEFAARIQGHPKAINTELTRLVNAGEIVKVCRGVYRLPEL